MTESSNEFLHQETFDGVDGINGTIVAVPSKTGKKTTLGIEVTFPDGDPGDWEFEFTVSLDGINFGNYVLDPPGLLGSDDTPIGRTIKFVGFNFVKVNQAFKNNDVPAILKLIST